MFLLRGAANILPYHLVPQITLLELYSFSWKLQYKYPHKKLAISLLHNTGTHESRVEKETECPILLGISLQKEKDLLIYAAANIDKLLPRELAELSYRCRGFQVSGSFYLHGVDICRQQC